MLLHKSPFTKCQSQLGADYLNNLRIWSRPVIKHHCNVLFAVVFTDPVVFPWLSEDVALTDFFHPFFSVCVCICGHVCVLSVQVSRCTFTHSYTHAYCQNWHSLFVALPTMTTSSNVKNFLFFFWFCFVLYMYILFFFLVSTRWWNTGVLCVLPQIGTSHTAVRCSVERKET